MGFADHYLSRQKGFSPFITDLPSERLGFVAVIPAYCEPGITGALQSLWNCARPKVHVEVIIVVNSPENAHQSVREVNLSTLRTVSSWIKEHDDPTLHFFLMDKTKMPARDAGVGLARKTGMDEALFRFSQINNPKGYILSFDADSKCDANYFTALEEKLKNIPAADGFAVYFEHPVSGKEFPDKVYRGIIDYELHLRCLNQFLRYTGFPHAYHTVGSCFGVRADVYAAQGGMNKRKAGEDFYFLHKIIPLGHFIDITGTRVIPSPRPSDRAPFGTGAAIDKFLSSENEYLTTYSPDCFITLRLFLSQITNFYKKRPDSIEVIIKALPEPLKNYLLNQRVVDAFTEINANCSSVSSFINRFYRWFDAFRIIKYLNYASQTLYKQIPVREAAIRFLEISGHKDIPEKASALELLQILRRIETFNHQQL
jgi:hypothetical protein